MIKKMLLLIGLFVLISGCEQQLKGNRTEFVDMQEALGCITPFDNKDAEFVINSQDEYEGLMEYKSRSRICEDFTLPAVDFSQKTLLGKYTQGGGCSVDFVKNVYGDDEAKTITYSIKVKEKGLCEKLGMGMNWVLVDKIPSNYSVVFDVRK